DREAGPGIESFLGSEADVDPGIGTRAELRVEVEFVLLVLFLEAGGVAGANIGRAEPALAAQSERGFVPGLPVVAEGVVRVVDLRVPGTGGGIELRQNAARLRVAGVALQHGAGEFTRRVGAIGPQFD